jgi:hypothetical protein
MLLLVLIINYFGYFMKYQDYSQQDFESNMYCTIKFLVANIIDGIAENLRAPYNNHQIGSLKASFMIFKNYS